MTELPAPPYSEHADLTGLDYMPLMVHQLDGSKSWARCGRRPELAFYLVNVWVAAWLSVPAGSLENDEDILRAASQCPPDKWSEYREDIVHGFVLHSDNRLYHSTVAQQVTIALGKREKWRTKKRIQRAVTPDVQPVSPGTTPGQGGEIALRPTTDDRHLAVGRENIAKAIAADFHTLRNLHWPNSGSMASPDSTLETQALAWIDSGASVEFARAHMDRTMRDNHSSGDLAPTNLGFCGKSLISALAKTRRQVRTPQSLSPPSPPRPTPQQVRDDLHRQAAA